MQVKSVSLSGFVPILKVQSLNPPLYINDSLAICEFLAESHLDKSLWPKDRLLRAMARSSTAEMHSGFSELRNTYDTNFVAKYTGKILVTEQGQKEIERILSVWGEARVAAAARLRDLGEVDEGFLFGGFGIADAFFWPVLWVCIWRL
jgi:glutathione S-transferase